MEFIGFDVCIYHAGCMDGWCSAWLAASANSGVSLRSAKYGDRLPDVSEYAGRRVLIADFSYPPEVMAEMAEHAHSIVMLDHHQTAIDRWKGQETDAGPFGLAMWKPNVGIVFDTAKSGAVLTWEHMQQIGEDPDDESPHCPWLVRYVQDRDLWKWELPDSHAVSAYIRCQPQTMEAWTEMYWTLEFTIGRREVVTAGNLILAREQQIIDKAVNSAVEMSVAGFEVPVVNATECVSEIGHALCRGKPFAAMYFDDLKRGLRIWSLRSEDGGEDVAKVAERFGGGGHKHAAGYQTPLMI